MSVGGVMKDDAVCGVCGEAFKDHIPEISYGTVKYFCDKYHSQDFDDNPSDGHIVSWLDYNKPRLLKLIIDRWRKDNGHETTNDD
jgi:YHS domain-containing protein